ncbi:hypothetical protein D3C81_2015150 [compost metagenome]
MRSKRIALRIKTAFVKLAMHRAKTQRHSPALPCTDRLRQVISVECDTCRREPGLAAKADNPGLMGCGAICTCDDDFCPLWPGRQVLHRPYALKRRQDSPGKKNQP